jgi:diguanylate cyclase (GGDEF)-like protein
MLLLLTSESENDRPLWIERAAARWTQRRSSSSVVFAALVAIVLVGAMDGAVAGLAGFDFVATVFYIAPISFAAWGAGARTGLVVAIFAASVEAAATWWGAHGGIQPWILAVSVGLELLVFLGAAFTFARLRWHMERHRQLSRTDSLTGLANERAFEEVVRQETARIDRKPAAMSIVYLDVDRFKELNDTRGHSAGNACLRLIGQTLRASLRAVDTAARVGGDEFALLLPDTGAEECRLVVERLRERLRREGAAAGFTNSFSVGAVTFEGMPPPYDQLVAVADRAMYRVKGGTRDAVHYEVFDSPDIVPGPAPGSPVPSARAREPLGRR